MRKFQVIVECQTPKDSDDNHADAYASSVRDYICGPLFVEGIGFQLGVQSVEYEMTHDEQSGEYCEGRR